MPSKCAKSEVPACRGCIRPRYVMLLPLLLLLLLLPLLLSPHHQRTVNMQQPQ